jgi:hypothetical protein
MSNELIKPHDDTDPPPGYPPKPGQPPPNPPQPATVKQFAKSAGYGLVWIHDADGNLVRGTVAQLDEQVRRHQENLRMKGVTHKEQK